MYDFTKPPQNLFNYFSFHKNLNNDEILDIFQITSNYEFNPGYIAGKVENNQIRSSKLKWIPPLEETQNLYKMLEELIVQANSNFFNFNIIGSMEYIQYTEYYDFEQGNYSWHRDGGVDEPPNSAYRKLSLTIQLSDPSEYEGGDLEISIPQPEKNLILKAPKEKGKVIIFPSYMWHRVTPVTKGVRKSLVWWVGGTPFR